MSGGHHPDRKDLIDFVEGELSPPRADEISAHLRTCETCRSYVDSLRATYSLLEHDTLPEPPPGFWTYLAQRVRHRARSKRRRLVLILAPGLAVVFVAVVLSWWSMRAPVEDFDSIDLFLADMSTGEIVESLSGSDAYEDVVAEAAGDEMRSLEEYLVDSEDIYDLIEALSEEERDRFLSEIEGLMKETEETSNVMTDLAGKEC
jgi:hypothetical protein